MTMARAKPSIAAAWLAAGAVVAGACAPIGVRGDDQAADQAAPDDTGLFGYRPDARPLRIGELVPDFELIDGEGQRLRLSALRDRVVALTFFAAGEADEEDEILARFGELAATLHPTVARDARLVSVLLDDGERAAELLRARSRSMARPGPAWTFVRPTLGAGAAMSAAFGVVVWESAAGDVRHTFNTVIIDRRGRLADQFPGLDGWSAADLAAGLDHVARR